MKECEQCKNIKGFCEFTKRESYKDGFIKICKKCKNSNDRKSRMLIGLSNNNYIYLIKNSAWEGYLKVGRTIDIKDRLKSYQTGSPFRDYELVYLKKVKDPYTIEEYFRENFECLHEWVLIDEEHAIKIIETLCNKIDIK